MCETFGGGLARFRAQNLVDTNNNNTCRELVEVEGGVDWRIRRLEERYETICWKYPGSSVIVNYHMNRLQNLTSSSPRDENHKLFYAKVSNFVSPVEICLQPKYVRSARQGIYRQMNAFYNSTSTTTLRFDENTLFCGIACAAFEDGNWYRGKIVQMSGEQHVVVELVDIGIQHLIPLQSIRPLFRRFGRAPPLSLKCRVDRISINDLETKDLVEFKKIVESCNALFRVELKSTNEPFLIDLLHPTIAGKHVCEKFLPSPEDLKKIERLDRNWVQHCRKVLNEVDDDEDDVWNHHWSGDHRENEKRSFETPPIRIVKRLDKCPKAPRFETDQLIVGHIENSQLIYLHYPWQLTSRQKIENHLKTQWTCLKNVEILEEDHVYAIKLANDDSYRRAIFINPKSWLLLDYGIYIEHNTESRNEIRFLSHKQELNEPPMLTIVSLAGASTTQPAHFSETRILRDIVRRGDVVSFQWDGKSKNTPMRGFLFTVKDQKNISHMMSQKLIQTRQSIECRQLVQYNTPRFRPSSTLSNYIYHNCCHHSYSKGVLENDKNL